MLFCKLAALAAVVAVANAECPNACSGHGTCSNYDQCTCYRNWQAADCSERTCPFDLAHVDTPHGDLDGSTGTLFSHASNVILVGSTVYPQGTSERFPIQTGAGEGHFYMECSNKGICDRKTGECECFDGYEGTSCQRASCPNQCSGHGTCETIEELAEDRDFDYGNVFGNSYGGGYGNFKADMHTYGAYPSATDTTETTGGLNYPGQVNNGGTGTSVVKAYAAERGNVPYKLWDKRATMGCACDAGYFAPDCSLRKCKFGVDPLFLAKGTPSYEKGSIGIMAAQKTATHQFQAKFDLTLFDVFGEDYVIPEITVSSIGTAALPTVTGTSCADIGAYFPNDMLSDTSTAQTFCTLRTVDAADNDPAGVDVGSFDGQVCDGGGSLQCNRVYYTFDYGAANPGFIKDFVVSNPSGQVQTTAAGTATVGSATFVKHMVSQGEWGEFVTTSDFSFVLPAYIKAATASTSFTTPQKVDQWLSNTAAAQKSADVRIYTGSASFATTEDLTITSAVTCANEIIPYHTHGLAWGGVGLNGQASYTAPTDATAHATAPAVLMHQLCTVPATGLTTAIGEFTADRDDTANAMTIMTKLTPNYEYVSQCSNRGSCDSETGLCKCYAGYTNDNCDTQTAII